MLKSVRSYFPLQKLGQPITDRYRESRERPAALEEFAKCITHVRKFLDLYEQKVMKLLDLFWK